MNEMLKALKEYLDNGIIRVLCNPITNYSCVSFHDTEHGVYVNTGLGASSIRSVGSLLKIFKNFDALKKEVKDRTDLTEFREQMNRILEENLKLKEQMSRLIEYTDTLKAITVTKTKE